ncbi:MAG: hypothetical protein A2096_12750 [Spirochaetes bacterium GWF1_41_5]|nr:MAG: hypothetical protein A2096_12750 [Spirochaetes bacterium GWF1_41_5]HBE04848.1 electron transport complex subunit RsxC [Spirochaetia bacterium]
MQNKGSLYAGICPSHYEEITMHKPAIRAKVPERLYIPLSQHIGAPAVSCVEPGYQVKKGTLIGKINGIISANVHASADGTVEKIEKRRTGNGMISDTVVIKTDPAQAETEPVLQPVENITREQIIRKITDAGIVGMGGATFPTQVKLAPPPGKTIDTLIINAAECEPYLTCDYRLMIEHTAEIISGIVLLKKCLGVNRVIIGIEADKPEAAKLLDEQGKIHNIEVFIFSVKYPQGAEKQLIFMSTGRQVPSGGLPMDIGCVVSNVATIYAAYRAVYFNESLTERYITFSGRALKNPRNMIVKTGTLLGDLINENDFSDKPEKIISGGPMMGFSLENLDVPVTKGTSGFLFFSAQDYKKKKEYNCISCGACAFVCPAGLLPSELLRLTENMKYLKAMENNLLDCMECGSCSFVCPAGKQIVQSIKTAKQMARNKLEFNVYCHL